MRDMNILNEIADFKRLSGLLTESIGGVLRVLPTGWFDEFITPAVKASDSKIDDIADDISRGGIRSLTDDQLIYLLSKLPAEQVAKKLVDTNVFFSPTNVDRIRQNYLNKLTRGDMTWDEITLQLQNGKRTIWGQSPNMTDSVYDDISDIMDEVTQKYLDDVEDFIRKNGDEKTVAKLPKPTSQVGRSLGEGLGDFLRWAASKQGFVLNTIRKNIKGYDALFKEADVLMKEITDEYVKKGANANINSKVKRLTEIATAAKNKNTGVANELLDEWLRDAQVPLRVRQKIKKNDWYVEWLDILDGYAKKDSSKVPGWASGINDYRIAFGRILPKSDATWTEYFKRIGNFILYGTPQLRSEIIGRLGTRGVPATVASRMAGHFIQVTVIVPALLATLKHLFYDPFIPGDQGSWKDKFSQFFPKWSELPLLSPLSWTYLDNLWRAGNWVVGNTDEEIANSIGGEVMTDYNETIEVLEGTYEGDKNRTQQTLGVQKFIRDKYPDFPYDKQIVVNSKNKVVFAQKTDGQGTIKYWPVYLIDGKVYLVNNQAKKRIELSKIAGSMNEGLINVIFEQVIDWGSGESTSDDEVEYDDVTTSDWREIVGLGGDEDGDTSGSEEDEDSGVDLSFLGGSGSSGPGWEFNRNPTGQLKADRDAARLDADSYTKGNIYVYKNPNGNEELVLAGKLPGGTPHLFKVEKNDSGKWGWINDSQEPPMWEDFKDY